MLARLLRFIYLFQLTCGALLGSYLAWQSNCQGGCAAAWLWLLLTMLLLPLGLQFLLLLISMLRSRSDHARGNWWRALAGEYKAAVLVFMLRQPWPHQHNPVQLPDPAAGTARIPVLLVHGYICNHRVWDTVVQTLLQSGHPVLAIDLEPLFTSIDVYAAQIDQAVSRLLVQTQATQVALVGHSMGGLALRAWLRAYSTTRQAQVARLITLGTPHQGTQIVSASITPNGAQMIWHSPWLAALERSETTSQRALMQIVLTHQDNIVYPQRAQVLQGAAVKEFVGLGHLELCLNQAVLAWICQQIAPESLRVST